MLQTIVIIGILNTLLLLYLAVVLNTKSASNPKHKSNNKPATKIKPYEQLLTDNDPEILKRNIEIVKHKWDDI